MIAADALAQVKNRSANVTLYWVFRNTSTGEKTGGVFMDVRVQPDRDRIRGHVWRDVLAERTNRADPATALYGNVFSTFLRPPGGEYERTGPAGNYAPYPVDRPGLLRSNASDVDVVARNESAQVVVVDRDQLVTDLNPNRSTTSYLEATVVVSLDDADPRLERYTVTWRSNGTLAYQTYVFQDVGDVTVERPEGVPFTPLDAVKRAVHGWGRIGNALGLWEPGTRTTMTTKASAREPRTVPSIAESSRRAVAAEDNILVFQEQVSGYDRQSPPHVPRRRRRWNDGRHRRVPGRPIEFDDSDQ